MNKISVHYKSFIHKAHKEHMLNKAQSCMSFLNNSGLLRAKPDLLDSINEDSFLELLLKSLGAPKEIFRDKNEKFKYRNYI